MSAVVIDRPTRAVIDLEAFRRNLKKLRGACHTDFFCPMIKANAYGHGATLIYDVLRAEKIQSCGVALLEEALELRESFSTGPEILIFGSVNPDHLAIVAREKFVLVVGSLGELREIAANSSTATATESLDIHLKFDTGMHRRGLTAGDIPAATELLKKNSHLRLRGIATHFYFAERGFGEDSVATRQLELFAQIAGSFPAKDLVFHSLNSIAAWELRGQPLPVAQHLLGMRPGLYLYGAHPDFEPVLSLRSKIAQLRDVRAGEGVSYGWTWTASRASKIGIVPLGYADGFPRRLGNQTSALLAGRAVPVVGTICMDLLLIDLTDHAFTKAELGEEITFFGRDPYGKLLSVDKLAENAGTIAWEILAQVGSRVPRVATENDSK